jgi:hypothetical protein
MGRRRKEEATQQIKLLRFHEHAINFKKLEALRGGSDGEENEG